MKDEINIFDFTKLFPDEAACIAHLEQSCWPGGNPVSPFGGGEAYRIGTRPGLYKCKHTGKNFSVRQGTIFEESRLPLKKWFFAIYLLHSMKKGISSIQLAKYLGVTQTTAWLMLQKIKYAVENKKFQEPTKEDFESGDIISALGDTKHTKARTESNKITLTI